VPPPGRPEPSLGVPPEIASFSSRQPDWTVPLEADTMPWTERWGRKALGWSLALAGIVAVAGTAAWMVRETKVESTLAIVADHSPAPVAPPPTAVPVVQAAPEEPPPLKLLPPEAPASAAVPETPVSEPPVEAALAAAAAAAPAVAALPEKTEAAPPPPVKKKPAAKPRPERRVAAAPAKRDKPAVKKAAKPKAPSERVLARALADAQRSRQESLARPATPQDAGPSQPPPTGALAETLRMCRAAGYHATACIKRGCEATRFGLVCRG
jgi:outer membrane biosynthesis protein TonB